MKNVSKIFILILSIFNLFVILTQRIEAVATKESDTNSIQKTMNEMQNKIAELQKTVAELQNISSYDEKVMVIVKGYLFSLLDSLINYINGKEANWVKNMNATSDSIKQAWQEMLKKRYYILFDGTKNIFLPEDTSLGFKGGAKTDELRDIIRRTDPKQYKDFSMFECTNGKCHDVYSDYFTTKQWERPFTPKQRYY